MEPTDDPVKVLMEATLDYGAGCKCMTHGRSRALRILVEAMEKIEGNIQPSCGYECADIAKKALAAAAEEVK